jgi:hypothetical protein|tara:strand:- start:30 stop:179 length:150 start_codon:yes stop_codon:yes gene_type:complete
MRFQKSQAPYTATLNAAPFKRNVAICSFRAFGFPIPERNKDSIAPEIEQ